MNAAIGPTSPPIVSAHTTPAITSTPAEPKAVRRERLVTG
jgi:hypothetical protein